MRRRPQFSRETTIGFRGGAKISETLGRIEAIRAGRSNWRRPRDAMRDGYLIAATLWTFAVASGLVPGGIDARSFYDHRWPTPYDVSDYTTGVGFFYSPPVALLLWPFMTLGFQPFAALMSGAGLIALYGLLGRWAWLGLLLPPVWWDITAGNVNTVIGYSVAAGIARSAWWSVPILTKVTPGIGALWFPFRGQWRQFSIALGIPLSLCLASAFATPGLWRDWLSVLMSNSVDYVGPGYFTIAIPLLPRLVAACLLVAWGARASIAATVPIAAFLAVPIMWWSTPAILLGVIPLTPRLHRLPEARVRQSDRR